MNTNDITPEFQQKCEENYHKMQENTEVNDEKNKLKFVKMNMPAEHMDFIKDYYHLPNLVEVNRVSIYILKTLAKMEKDGYKFVTYKPEIKDGKEIMSKEIFVLSIPDLVKNIMNQLEVPLPHEE